MMVRTTETIEARLELNRTAVTICMATTQTATMLLVWVLMRVFVPDSLLTTIVMPIVNFVNLTALAVMHVIYHRQKKEIADK